MKKEQLEALRRILYLIINSIDQDYYSEHLTGLNKNEWKECLDLLKVLE